MIMKKFLWSLIILIGMMQTGASAQSRQVNSRLEQITVYQRDRKSTRLNSSHYS